MFQDTGPTPFSARMALWASTKSLGLLLAIVGEIGTRIRAIPTIQNAERKLRDVIVPSFRRKIGRIVLVWDICVWFRVFMLRRSHVVEFC